MRYMAKSHGFETFALLRDAADSGKLPEHGVSRVDPHRDLEIDSAPPSRELETSADNIPVESRESDEGVDLHAPEAPAPKKPAGLVGKRNVHFDDDEDEPAPPRKGRR
jgi:hypothetical protein